MVFRFLCLVSVLDLMFCGLVGLWFAGLVLLFMDLFGFCLWFWWCFWCFGIGFWWFVYSGVWPIVGICSIFVRLLVYVGFGVLVLLDLFVGLV